MSEAFYAFPQELRAKKQWVVWKKEGRDGTFTKAPYSVHDGMRASHSDPQTWGSFAEALSYYRIYQETYAGIGYVFAQGDGIIGIDLDHCVDEDGIIAPWATTILTSVGASYSEYSQSKTGIHALVRGTLPGGRGFRRRVTDAVIPVEGHIHPDAAIEMYEQKRFFVVTGDILSGASTAILFGQHAITQVFLLFEQQEKDTPPASLPLRKANRPGSLDAIVVRAKSARDGSGERFQALWNGGHDGYISDSEADLAFCNMLAFWSGNDATIIDALFRRSGRMREKWERDDYRNDTITKAITRAATVIESKEPTIDLTAFEASDVGNAEAVQALYGAKIHHSATMGWLLYTGTHWKSDSECEVDGMVVDTLRKRRRQASSSEDKEAIVKCTRCDNRVIQACKARLASLPGIFIDITTFDSVPYLLNTQSGVCDLRTGTITPHHCTQRFTYCLASLVGETVDATPWVEFLTNAVSGDADIVRYLQRAVGYSLTGLTSEEVLFYLYGPSRSGKGTFTETLLHLLEYPLAIERDFNTFTAKREASDQNFDLAALRPARFVVASESNKYQSLNPAKIKSLTGGNGITAAFKNKDSFTYRPQFKVWLVSNHPVNADADDNALWGRVRVIEFPHSHLGVEDKLLKELMKSEEVQRGILWWAIQGAVAWFAERDLVAPESVNESNKAHRYLNDSVQQWLDDRRYELVPQDTEAYAPVTQVYLSYKAWCDANNIEPKHQRTFSFSLQEKGCKPNVQKRIKDHMTRCYVGIRLTGGKIIPYPGTEREIQ